MNKLEAVASDVSYALTKGKLSVDQAYERLLHNFQKKGVRETAVNLVIHRLREEGHHVLANAMVNYSPSANSFGTPTAFDSKDITGLPDNSKERHRFLDQLLRQNKHEALLHFLAQKEKHMWDAAEFHFAIRAQMVTGANKLQIVLDLVRDAKQAGKYIGSEDIFVHAEAQAFECVGRHQEGLAALNALTKEKWSSYIFERAIQICSNFSPEKAMDYAMEGTRKFPENTHIICAALQSCIKHRSDPMSYLAVALQKAKPNFFVLMKIAEAVKVGLFRPQLFMVLMNQSREQKFISKKDSDRILIVLRKELLDFNELSDQKESKSGLSEAAKKTDIRPIDRTAYHVLRNQQTPRERDGSFHDPPAK